MKSGEAKNLFINLRDNFEWSMSRTEVIQLLPTMDISHSNMRAMLDHGILRPKYGHHEGHQMPIYYPSHVHRVFVAKSMANEPEIWPRWDAIQSNFGGELVGERGRRFFESEIGQWAILEMCKMAELDLSEV